MFEGAQSANVTRSTPGLPRPRWHRYSLNQRQTHLKLSPWTSSRNSLSPRSTTRSLLSLTMTAPRRPSSYPAPRKSRQRGWRNSSSNECSNTMDSPGKLSVTGTPDSHQSSPESCAVSWASNRISPRRIILGRTGSQNTPISGWKPISGSSSTINRTTGQCTCPWRSLHITIGRTRPRGSPPSIY